MSTLNVSNITDGTDTVGTSYVLNGAAKAWATVNSSGTASIRDSFNVASITDIGVGQISANLSSAMVDTNQAASGSTADQYPYTYYLSTSSALRITAVSSSLSFTDFTKAHGQTFGDLA